MKELKDYLQIVKLSKESEAAQLQSSTRLFLNLCEQVQSQYKNLGIHPLYEINVLDYNGLCETQTSQIIKLILSYEQDSEFPIFKSFIKQFYGDNNKILLSINKPLFSAEERHVDVCVKEKGKYAIVIENKLKGAVFQRNQLGRYIKEMLVQNFDLSEIYLIIIPGWLDWNFTSHVRKSVWKAPKDWYLPNNERKCCDFSSSEPHACWCDNPSWVSTKWCEECCEYKTILEKAEGHIKIIDQEFANWLMNTAEKNSSLRDEPLLRSAMIQFAHYIKGLYNIRLTQKEIMESINVITKELGLDYNNPEESYNKVEKTISDLNKIRESLEKLKVLLQIKIWKREIENYFPNIRVDSDEASFGILVNGIYCGVWEENNKHYWGFYHDKNKILPNNAKEMVQKIISETKAISKGETTNFFAWDYTSHGAERIKSFIEASLKLGYECQLR